MTVTHTPAPVCLPHGNVKFDEKLDFGLFCSSLYFQFLEQSQHVGCDASNTG